MSYELVVAVTKDQVETLPPEFKLMVLRRGVKPDEYEIRKSGDLDLDTGFLSFEELKGLNRSFPMELTFANRNDRVKFYTKSELSGASSGRRL